MDYGITLLVGSLRFLRITEDEFRRLKRAKDNLLAILGMEEKFDFVMENYAEYERELLGTTLHHLLFQDFDWSFAIGDTQNLNRRLINLLASSRLYLDQIQHDVRSVYGEDSEAERQLRRDIDKEYDNSLGYRVMDAIRNHIQHRALPIRSLGYNQAIDESRSPDGHRYEIEPALIPSELRADCKFKRSVLSELEAKGEKLNLTPMVREFVESLSSIHEKLRQFGAADVEEWDNAMVNTQERARESFGEKLIGLAVVAKDDDGSYQEEVQIFEHFIERRKLLARKNCHLSGLAKRFVSGDSRSRKDK